MRWKVQNLTHMSSTYASGMVVHAVLFMLRMEGMSCREASVSDQDALSEGQRTKLRAAGLEDQPGDADAMSTSGPGLARHSLANHKHMIMPCIPSPNDVHERDFRKPNCSALANAKAFPPLKHATFGCFGLLPLKPWQGVSSEYCKQAGQLLYGRSVAATGHHEIPQIFSLHVPTCMEMASSWSTAPTMPAKGSNDQLSWPALDRQNRYGV